LTRPARESGASAGPGAFAESRLHSSIVKERAARRTGWRGQRNGPTGHPPDRATYGLYRCRAAPSIRRPAPGTRRPLATAPADDTRSSLRRVQLAGPASRPRRPARARAMVSSSAYCRSAPAGRPWARRVTRTPKASRRSAR